VFRRDLRDQSQRPIAAGGPEQIRAIVHGLLEQCDRLRPGSNLSGTIKLSSESGTDDVNGTVNGGTISFGTVGSQAITYSGSVSGDSMSGTYKVETPNGSVGGSWSATKGS
jgi:hypothetical protein